MRSIFTRLDGFSVSLQVGITPAAVALLQSSGWWNTHTRHIAEASLPNDTDEPWEGLKAALRRLFADAAITNRPTTIVIADHWVRLFMVTPPQNATSMQDLHAAAAMRYRELFGDDIRDWRLEGDWQINRAFLACAMPSPLLDALYAIAREYQLTLLSVIPHFIAALNRWRRSLNGAAWFGVAQDNLLTLGAIPNQRLCMVHTAQIPAGGWQDQQWLPTFLVRQALKLNLPVPEKLQVCGHLPGWPVEKRQLPNCSRLDAGSLEPDGAAMTAAVHLARMGASK